MTTSMPLTWDVFVSPLELTVVDGGHAGPAAPGFDDLPPNANTRRGRRSRQRS